MRRKIKRTVKVRTTETWIITWQGQPDKPQPAPRRKHKPLSKGQAEKGDIATRSLND